MRLRAGRTDALVDELYLAAETDLGAVVGQVDAVDPSFLVIDSVQTMAHPEVDGAPGGVTQVREVTGALVRLAKERHIAVVLVGHVTKDGAIAGPADARAPGRRRARVRRRPALRVPDGASDEEPVRAVGRGRVLRHGRHRDRRGV